MNEEENEIKSYEWRIKNSDTNKRKKEKKGLLDWIFEQNTQNNRKL